MNLKSIIFRSLLATSAFGALSPAYAHSGFEGEDFILSSRKIQKGLSSSDRLITLKDGKQFSIRTRSGWHPKDQTWNKIFENRNNPHVSTTINQKGEYEFKLSSEDHEGFDVIVTPVLPNSTRSEEGDVGLNAEGHLTLSLTDLRNLHNRINGTFKLGNGKSFNFEIRQNPDVEQLGWEDFIPGNPKFSAVLNEQGNYEFYYRLNEQGRQFLMFDVLLSPRLEEDLEEPNNNMNARAEAVEEVDLTIYPNCERVGNLESGFHEDNLILSVDELKTMFSKDGGIVTLQDGQQIAIKMRNHPYCEIIGWEEDMKDYMNQKFLARRKDDGTYHFYYRNPGENNYLILDVLAKPINN